jgi:AraC family transcriptional regulator
VTTTVLAVHASLSSDHFAHVFREDLDMTVTSFIGHLRVEVAKCWLAGSDRKLAAIATDAGCTDAPHLSRLFRRYAGCTPGAYRRVSCLDIAEPGWERPGRARGGSVAN